MSPPRIPRTLVGIKANNKLVTFRNRSKAKMFRLHLGQVINPPLKILLAKSTNLNRMSQL